MDGVWMYSRDVHLTIPKELLGALDKAARKNYESRSEFIRLAIILRLNRQSIVEAPSRNEALAKLLELEEAD